MNTFTLAAPRVPHPYETRHLRFLRLAELGPWRLKLYGIARFGRSPREALVEASLERAAGALTALTSTVERHGVGFIIAHDAATVCFTGLYWWQSDNELHQRIWAAPLDRPQALSPVADPAAGCVWELGIIDFERRAWHADVLANPAGPDLERYLARRLDMDL